MFINQYIFNHLLITINKYTNLDKLINYGFQNQFHKKIMKNFLKLIIFLDYHPHY
jgi:hypothetical protein